MNADPIKIEKWFPWLAAQALIRNDQNLQEHIWVAWAQLMVKKPHIIF
jgi:hypothetical protein